MIHRTSSRIASFAVLAAIAGTAHAQSGPSIPELPDGQLVGIINSSTDDSPPILPFALGTRWSDGMGAVVANGTPINLTWSVAPDGLALLDSNGSAIGSNTIFATLDMQFGLDVMAGDPRATFGGRMGESGIPNNLGGWFPVFQAALESWSVRSGINFSPNPVTRTAADPPTPDPDDRDDSLGFNFQDGGAAWHTEGPYTAPGVIELGDIRFAMGSLDGPGGRFFDATGTDLQSTAAMGGHIIFDSAEDWTDPGVNDVIFQTLFNAIAQAVGTSMGLLEACPEINRQLMEMPPLTGFSNSGPQFEDIRAVHRLYGDNGEANEEAGNAVPIGVVPNTPNSIVILSSVPTAQQPARVGPLSLHSDTDVDFYSFMISLEEVTFTFEAIPDGSTLTISEVARDPVTGCDPADNMAVNMRTRQDLQIAIFDQNGMLVQSVDLNNNGEPEVVAITSTLADFGLWTVRVQSDGAFDRVQAYVFRATATPATAPTITDDFQRFLNDEDRLNIATWTTLGLRSNGGAPAIDFSQFDPPLQRAVIGVVDILQPNLQHTTLNDQTLMVAAWPGTGPGDPDRAVSDRLGPHATGVAGAALGGDFFELGDGTLEDTEFVGVATEAILATGAPANFVTSGGAGVIGLEAFYYSLFGLTDSFIATQVLGMPAPATIINSSFGGITSQFPGITGDGDLAIAFDALVFMRDVTVVLPSGDSGGIDQTAACEFDGDPTAAGGAYVGARTVNNPATCFNAIVVGGVATQFDTGDVSPDDDNMDTYADEITVVSSFSGKGPIDSYDYDNQMVMTDTRPGVHLIAPGVGAVGEPPFQDSCPYPGKIVREGLRVPTFDPDEPVVGQEEEFTSSFGTSISAPIVAGAVALMEDFTTIQGNDVPSSPLIYKACLINAAQKLEGWSNNGNPGMPQDSRDGREEMGLTGSQLDLWDDETMQPLDLGQGGGWLDMRTLFVQFAGENPLTHTRDLFFTPPNRSIVTRVFIPPFPDPFPLIGGLDEDEPDLDFPTREQRGASPVQIRATLASATIAASESDFVIPVTDFGDFGDVPIGGGGGGGNLGPLTRIVTGRVQNTTLPFIPGIPGLPRSGQLPLAFNPILVEMTGWDIAQLGVRTVPGQGRVGFVDYIIPNVAPGDVITVTLVWNRRVEVREPDFNNLANPGVGIITAIELEDLDLQLYVSNEFGEASALVAESNSEFNNVEHITYQSPGGGTPAGTTYLMRVEYIGTDYDLFLNGLQGDVQYCLAWRTGQTGGTIFNPLLFSSVDPNAPEFTFSDLIDLVLGYGATIFYDNNYTSKADVNEDGIIDFTDLTRMLNNM